MDGLPHKGLLLWDGKDKKGAVLRFVRKLRFTAVTMRPQRETQLELIFHVPKETTSATLRFLDSLPIELTLTPENAEATGPLKK